MAVENCRDCDYVSNADARPSDGKCSDCHGSGYVGGLEGLGKAVAGQSQKCETCDGSGKCQTCYGKGYLR